MEQIKTKDGSFTFRNKEYDELYHSISGAEEEAVKKYAGTSGFDKLIKKQDSINILDICFGLGYNTAAALDYIWNLDKSVKINVVGLEKDKEILDKINEINSSFENYNLIKKSIKNNLEYKNEKFNIKIILGDAKKTIKRLDTKFDAVFFDPFSPNKNPELWTEAFFRDIFRLMKQNAVLTTYSCAVKIRKNLKNAGFIVKDGPCVGRRAPSTIAIKH
jgi:chorismate dehydratase